MGVGAGGKGGGGGGGGGNGREREDEESCTGYLVRDEARCALRSRGEVTREADGKLRAAIFEINRFQVNFVRDIGRVR